MATRYSEMTEEQRQRWREYTRNYRRANPDKVRQWRLNYIKRKAARLLAEDAAGEGGDGA